MNRWPFSSPGKKSGGQGILPGRSFRQRGMEDQQETLWWNKNTQTPRLPRLRRGQGALISRLLSSRVSRRPDGGSGGHA